MAKRKRNKRNKENAPTPLLENKNNSMLDKINVTQPLIDANAGLTVVPGDELLPTQVTAPVTQAMLDADPALVEAGVKVGDILSEGTVTPLNVTIAATIDQARSVSIALNGDVTAKAVIPVNPDNTFSGTISGSLNTA